MLALLEQLLVFTPIALVAILAPGPDNLGTLSLGISRGRSAGLAFALGCAAGCLTHTCWAALGVTTLLAASPIAFTVLKCVGAAYLGYLGVLAIRHAGNAVHVDSMDSSDAMQNVRAEDTPSRFFRRGLIANAINPKVALFFLAFLPQFVRTVGPSKPLQIGLLGLTFGALTVVVFGTVALFAGRIGLWLRARPSVGRRLDQATGILFIGLGVRLLLQHR